LSFIGVTLLSVIRRALILGFAIVVALPLAAGKKPKTAPLLRLQDQNVELTVFWLPTPVQKCTNWAWAVAVEAMLKPQQVTIKQNAWVQKANYGEVCIDDAPSLESLAKLVNGAYVLDDGRHVAWSRTSSPARPPFPTT
jgi:hypothetical protein